MSGIYIPGMEMPGSCYDCPLLYVTSLCDGSKDCPLVPVPEHGDLIDRYDLKNKEITIDYDEWDDTFEDGLLFVADLIDKAPTIIPADKEGEG